MHTNVAPSDEATVDAEAKKQGVNVAISVSNWTAASSRRLDHNTLTVRRHVVFFLCCFFFHWRPLGGIFSACESPERLCRLENINKASIDNVLSSKGVEFQFWVSYPFKATFWYVYLPEVRLGWSTRKL